MQARQLRATAASGANPDDAWSPAAARDRLSSTAFLAALFHGILILGITFSAPRLDRDDITSSMEVVLVTSEFEDQAPPDHAVLLAQRNLAGAGNAPVDTAVRTRARAALRSRGRGSGPEGADAPARPGEPAPVTREQQFVLAQDSPLKALDEGEPDRAPEEQRSTLPSISNEIDIVGRMASETAIPDERPRELLISANTRESRIATYLNNWKRKVEQVGTLNFPFAARPTDSASSPVLEVAINADGGLRDVVVLTSSGQRNLDDAAMQILRLAAPFEPFPEELRSDYDVLRFAYEWHFSDGDGRVRTRTAAAW